jgi:hypothetical protein
MEILSEFSDFYNGRNPLKAEIGDRMSAREIRAERQGAIDFILFYSSYIKYLKWSYLQSVEIDSRYF